MITLPRKIDCRSRLRQGGGGRGFTLVEILMVVTIIGVSAAVIIPQIGSRDDLRCTSMARAMMSDLLYAQSRAVSTQRRHFVRFDAENGRYEVLDQMTPTERVITHPITRGPFRVPVGAARNDELNSVALGAVAFDTHPVLMFDEMGTPHAYNPDTFTAAAMVAGSVRLQTPTHSLTISVEPYSGELRLD